MQSRYLLIIILITVSVPIYAQGELACNARSLALSGTSVTLHDFWSGLNNQAGLAFQRTKDIGINYYNRFMLSELATQTVIAVLPVGEGAMGASFSFFGCKPYHENHLSLHYGRILTKWLSAGIKLGYHHICVEATDRQASALSGEVGLLAIPVEEINIGLHVTNPTNSKFNTSAHEELVSGIQFGLSYYEKESFLFASQINWDNLNQVNLLMGVEYQIVKEIYIRIGIKLPNNTSYSFGIGTEMKRIKFDVAFEQHPCLGLSSSISLEFQINKHDH
jgi:hypothetical protein